MNDKGLTNQITEKMCHTIIDAESIAAPYEKTKARALTMFAKQLLATMQREKKLSEALEFYATLSSCYGWDKENKYHDDMTEKAKEALSCEYRDNNDT